ncbi:MAG: T9SS type A sorting domain-containing protein [Flavobacteriales bacterium]
MSSNSNYNTLQILDASGKIIHHHSINQPSFSFNLPNGLYIVRLTGPTGTITEKMIIQK